LADVELAAPRGCRGTCPHHARVQPNSGVVVRLDQGRVFRVVQLSQDGHVHGNHLELHRRSRDRIAESHRQPVGDCHGMSTRAPEEHAVHACIDGPPGSVHEFHPHVHTGDPGIVDLDLGMRVAADGGHPGPR
jgi:hypothetical protein